MNWQGITPISNALKRIAVILAGMGLACFGLATKQCD
jgi:hypothetical protein